MATANNPTLVGSPLTTPLYNVLMAEEIVPGSVPSYQVCKDIYLAHPLGAKMAEAPISMAQSEPREVSIPDSPEDMVRDRFLEQWDEDSADKHIFNTMSLARVYGIASLALLTEGKSVSSALEIDKLANADISFNIYDPLNTAGSLVLSQDPLSMAFQKVTGIAIGGESFHRSRSVTIMNENPIYISYTPSAFGFVGRSVYQRALYPLKSFIQTMITDDMISRKAGLLIAKQEQAGSIISGLMKKASALKSSLLKQGETNNVLTVGLKDEIESLNLMNINGAGEFARTNILKNIATAADMPAKLLENETLVMGFGEGTEDAKTIARYIDLIRKQMRPLYAFMDMVEMRRAWNADFYRNVQRLFPEYRDVSHEQAFYRWKNSFAAEWQSLLKEPPSEQVEVDDVKLKACIALVQVLTPMVDPDNKAAVIQWAADNFNELKMLFQNPLLLDYEALAAYEPPQMGEGEGDEPKAAPPFSARDSAIADYIDSATKLIRTLKRKEQMPKRMDSGQLSLLLEQVAAGAAGRAN